VGSGQFLVHADDSEQEVRDGIQKLLPEVAFELKPIPAKQARALRSTLSASQTDLVDKLSRKVSVKPKGRATSSFLLELTENPRPAAAATKDGSLRFNPEISKVKKPLGGGIGPVGITVGVGIAGKF